MHILLTISYDGTNYCGWQRQKNSVTVQQKIEEALFKLFGERIPIQGASRTDTGVHAIGQRAGFYCQTKIPADKIPLALNHYLPKDIAVVEAKEVAEDFHPQFDAVKKTYEYKILNAGVRNPIIRNYSEYIKRPLDVLKMREASLYFIGEHDFNAFCNSGGSAKKTVRNIYDMTVSNNESIITVRVCGNGFLYNMIRIISGTLVDAGHDKFPPEYIKDIILSRDREMASKTLSPRGLTLISVEY